jgi:serine O-acetyltransferase
MSAGVTTLPKPATRREMRAPQWWKLLYQDYRRYRVAGHSALGTVFLAQGFWANCVHRAFHALITSLPRGPLRSVAKTAGAFVQKAVEIATGICIPNKTEVGGGLYFPRFGAIILSHGSIGENCTIEQNVTLGIAGRGEERGHPTIGNRVFIGAGAMIVGKITVGDDAYIFPGSVVTRSVPPRAVVMGYPAKIVSYDGSFDWIAYDGMGEDAERRDALEKNAPR